MDLEPSISSSTLYNKRTEYVFPICEILFTHLPYSRHLVHASSTLKSPYCSSPVAHSVPALTLFRAENLGYTSGVSSRQNDKIFLIGYKSHQITGSKLPSNKRQVKLDAARLTIQEVLLFWGRKLRYQPNI